VRQGASAATGGSENLATAPFTRLRVPKISNLRTDPYEFADTTSNIFWESSIMQNGHFMLAAQAAAAKFADTFKQFPPIQKPNTFTVDDALAKMRDVAAGAG